MAPNQPRLPTLIVQQQQQSMPKQLPWNSCCRISSTARRWSVCDNTPGEAARAHEQTNTCICVYMDAYSHARAWAVTCCKEAANRLLNSCQKQNWKNQNIIMHSWQALWQAYRRAEDALLEIGRGVRRASKLWQFCKRYDRRTVGRTVWLLL